MLKFPKLPKADLPRLAQWLDLVRSVAAILFIPALCVYAAGLVYLMRDFAILGPAEVRLAVVNWFGWALIGLIGNTALGSMWLQKRNVKFTGQTPGGGGFSLDTDDDKP